MIFLHGITGFSMVYKNWLSLAEFTNRRRILVPDMRNHGDSVHTDEMSYQLMAEDVLRYADEQGLQTFTIMGHSMGGKLASMVAQISPERIDGLIMLDSPPRDVTELDKELPPERRLTVGPLLKRAAEFDIESCTSLPEAISKLAEALGDPIRAARVGFNIVPHESGKHMKWRCNIKVLNEVYPMNLTTFNPYTGEDFLVLVGENSFKFNKSDYTHVLPHLQEDRHVKVIKGAGHNIFVDNLEDTNRAICAFLDQIDGALC